MDPMDEDKLDTADGGGESAPTAGSEEAVAEGAAKNQEDGGGGVISQEEEKEDQPPQYAAPPVVAEASDLANGDGTGEEEAEKVAVKEETEEASKDGDAADEDPPEGETNDDDIEEGETKPKKRRSISRPVKKVLVAKKERELGITLLKDKRDLSEILPIHDCVFLAKNYWIFTHAQLQSFLDTLDAKSADATEEDREKAKNALEEFLSKLQTSGLLPSHPKSAGGAEKGEETQAEKPSTEKTDEDVVMAEAGDADEAKAAPSESEDKAATMLQEAFDSFKKNDAGGEAGAGGNVPEASDAAAVLSREDCEKRLQDWKEALATAASSSAIKMEDLFSIDGAVSVLFAPATLNFLASIPVRKLYDFLALKKTETGAVCDMYAEWRELCGLPKVPSLAAAKYLLGVNARIETALTVVPAVDAKERCWMIDPINVLTGAARDFLVVDQGLLTANSFVETRTKDLATALVVWRESNGMVPLKGSGKVAMISGWKAAAKEAMEIEAAVGKVLTDFNVDEIEQLDTNLLSTLPSSAPIPADEPAPPRRRSTGTPQKPPVRPGPKPKEVKSEPKLPAPPKVATRPTRSSAARKSIEKSPAAASSMKRPTPRSKKRATSASRQADYDLHSKMFLDEVLGEEITDTLSAANVHTAAQLFEADSKPGSVLSARLFEDEFVVEEDEAEPLVSGWCKSLRENLDVVRDGQPQVKSSEEDAPRPKRPKPEPKTPGSAAVRNASDPFELLSVVTKKFLNTMGITTAEQFLSTRTTEMAAEFVQFRIKEGMPELKGLGSIASVSGWKANCRRYAKSMGLDQLAEVEPAEKSSWKPAEDDEDSPPPPGKRAATVGSRKPEVLGMQQRRTVAVQSDLGTDPSLQFNFDLSMRKSDVNQESSDLYVTYEGAAPRSSEPKTSTSEVRVSGIAGSESLSILADAPPIRNTDRNIDGRVPFQSLQRGAGLINISRYGIRPLRDQDLTSLKTKVKNFVLSIEPEAAPEASHPIESNLLVNRTGIDKCQYLMYVAKPLELGQTLAASFPSIESLLEGNRYETTAQQERHRILESLHLLSKADLVALLGYLADELLWSTKLDEAVTQGNSREYADGDEAFKSQIATQIATECRARQRLHWLNWRILSLMDQAPLQPKEVRAKDSINFGRRKLVKDPNVKVLPHKLHNTVKDAFKDELEEGVLTLIELDDVCGSARQQKWCPLFRDFFDNVSMDILNSCVSNQSTNSELADALLKRLNDSQKLCVGEGDISVLVFSASPLNMSSTEKKDVVIANWKDDDDTMSDSSEREKVVAVTQNEVESGEAVLNSSWYRENISQILGRVLYAFGSCLDPLEFSARDILSSLKDAVGCEADAICKSEFHFPERLILPSDAMFTPQPPSYQFFLGIVWPTLREFGWSFQVNEFPSDVTYLAPRWKGDQKKKGKLIELAKRQRDRRRAETARTVGSLGLGPIPKLTKRLFLAGASFADENGDQSESTGNGPTGVTVEVVAQRFLEEVISGLDKNDDERKVRATKIVDSILISFDELAPELQSFDAVVQDDEEHASAVLRPCQKMGVDVLMQFLLILPSILRHSALSLQQINDTQQVIQELTQFVTKNYNKLFAKQQLPPVEHYTVKEKPTQNLVVTRLRNVDAGDDSKMSQELTDLIWPEDKGDLTEFVVNVISQAVPCRATQQDTQKRHRKIYVGYPGVVCRHCMGENGDGRYFFQTIDSLCTLGTAFEKHCARCPSVPAEIKEMITESKTRHVEQRRHLKSGSQQAFFVRLWERLRSMKIAGDTAAGYVPNLLEGQPSPAGSPRLKSSPRAAAAAASSSDSNNIDDEAGFVQEKIELPSPAAVVDYIRTTPPWKGSKEIDEALMQYYNCLGYGGRIYNTKVMPKHFSPAWLLAKVAPKQKQAKKLHMPG